MLKIMVISRRFYPPWCDGAVSYTKGLVEAILFLRKLGEDVQVTVLGLTDNLWFGRWHPSDLAEFERMPAKVVTLDGTHGNPEDTTRIFLHAHSDTINIAHVTYPGLDSISVKVALGMSKYFNFWVMKHLYMTPPSDRTSVIFNRLLSILSSKNLLKLKTVFSSHYLENCYGGKRQRVNYVDQTNIIPPAIDTDRFRRTKITKVDCVEEIFSEKSSKRQNLDFLHRSDFRVVYFGPLVYERSRYDLILQTISRLKKDGISSVSLIMIGRGFEDIHQMSQIKEYASKVGLSNRIALISKPLAEVQKISLLNYADIVLQPYPFSPRQMSIVDPPITILEAMATERKVVVSGLKSLRDIINHKSNGFILPNFKVASLEKTLLEALTRRDSVGVYARKTILENFSVPVVAQKLRKLYNTLGLQSK